MNNNDCDRAPFFIIILCGQYRKCGECVLFLIIYNKNKHKGGSERRGSVVVSTE